MSNFDTGSSSLLSAMKQLDERKKENIDYQEALSKAETSAPPVQSEKPQVDPLTHKVISSDDGKHHVVVAHPISISQMQHMASKAPPMPVEQSHSTQEQGHWIKPQAPSYYDDMDPSKPSTLLSTPPPMPVGQSQSTQKQERTR